MQETTESNKHQKSPLSTSVREPIQTYLDGINGDEINDLYRTVLAEIEKPLFEVVMQHTGSNQSKAAKLLGISRSTLRKKLQHYGFI